MTRMTGPDCVVMCNLINTHTHTHTHEWHRMTRMTGPDCVVMCNLINTHTHTHTAHTPEPPRYSKLAKAGNNICNVGGLLDFEKNHPGAKQEVEVEVLSRKNN